MNRNAGEGVMGDDTDAERALETFKAVLSTGWRDESLFEYCATFVLFIRNN